MSQRRSSRECSCQQTECAIFRHVPETTRAGQHKCASSVRGTTARTRGRRGPLRACNAQLTLPPYSALASSLANFLVLTASAAFMRALCHDDWARFNIAAPGHGTGRRVRKRAGPPTQPLLPTAVPVNRWEGGVACCGVTSADCVQGYLRPGYGNKTRPQRASCHMHSSQVR